MKTTTQIMKTAAQIAMAGITAVAIGALTGCSTAGPFVTSISSDGKGDLIVEKNTIHVNGLTGMVSAGENPTTEVIKVLPEPQPQPK
jgi:type IV secretion system protein VirB7